MDNGYTLLVGAKVKVEDVKKQLDTVSKDAHIDIKLNVKSDDLKNLSSTVTKSNEEVNKLIQSTKTLNDNIGKLGNSTKDTKKPMDDLGKSIDNADTKAKTMGQTFLDTTMKVAKFGASAKLIGTFQDAVVLAKDAIVEFDDAMIEFKKVSDMGDESLSAYTDRLGEMGIEVGKSRTQMLESATLFKKTGSTEEESADLARVANMYINIADEAVSASQASELLVSMMKAFNIEAKDSVVIINQINEVKMLDLYK